MLSKTKVFFMVLLAILFISCDPLGYEPVDLSTFESSVVGVWRGSAATGASWVITLNADKTFDQINTASGFSYTTYGSWTEVAAADVPGSTPGESYIQQIYTDGSPYYFWSTGDKLDNMQKGNEHAVFVKD